MRQKVECEGNKGEVWLCLLVLECSTSRKDTTENGLLDDGQETCTR